MIETAINWWDTAFYNRLNNSKPGHGCRIVVAQRLNEQDISGHVLEKQIGEWQHLCLPMKYEPERSFHTVLVPAWASEDDQPVLWKDPRTYAGELLWPERFDDEQVLLLEKTLGPYAAAGQLQQRPEPAGGGVIKREWWRLWEADKYPPMDFIVASLDTAYTAKQENDFSAMSIWGVFSSTHTLSPLGEYNKYNGRNGKLKDLSRGSELFDEGLQVKYQTDNFGGGDRPSAMLMYAWQERLEFHELIAKVTDTCKTFKVDTLLIENKASGISVGQEMRRTLSNETFGIIMIDPKSEDKLSRLHSVVSLFSEGMVYAPDRAFADMMITQVGVFPKGKHDDLVDTCSQALRYLRNNGLMTRAPEWAAEVNASMQHKGRPPESLYGI
jgi:predicted phage terminase large subunit-like protein